MTEEVKAAEETTTFNNIQDVLKAIDEKAGAGREAVAEYANWVEQLTGYKPNAVLGPIDVVKIVQKAFRL